MHPPLGKWFISTGIALLGFEPIAWRLAACAAGILLVAFVYLLCRRLTGSRLAAVVAAGLVALDPLAIPMSRIAMLDIFTATAGAAAILFLVIDGQGLRDHPARRRGLLRPWRLAAGIGVGVALATKWSGLLILVVAVILALAYDRAARPTPRDDQRRRFWATSIASTGMLLVVVPSLVYVLSYVGRLDGDLVALPWADGAWIREFAARQADMLAFHRGLDAAHSSASPAWSWFLGQRPVVLFHEPVPGGGVREILARVNPVIWLPALGATLVAAMTLIRTRSGVGPELVIGITVLGTYLPWLVLSSERSQVFAYYALPSVPFLAVALGWAVSGLPAAAGRVLAGALAAIAVAAFVLWLPLIYGWPMDGTVSHGDPIRQLRAAAPDPGGPSPGSARATVPVLALGVALPLREKGMDVRQVARPLVIEHRQTSLFDQDFQRGVVHASHAIRRPQQ
jgi:dolichyl-phosphate-mannose--protein O-mannosyl transferase